MQKILVFVLWAWLLIGMLVQGIAQVPDYSKLGAYPAQHFDARDYGAHNQNFSILADDRGFIFVGNAMGVVVFDGATFRVHSSPGRMTIRQLDKDSDGRIFYSGRRELGYLSSDSVGQLVFKSVVGLFPAEAKDYQEIRWVAISSKGVYASAGNYLFFLERDAKNGTAFPYTKVHFWQPQGRFDYIEVINDQLYVEDIGFGVMRLEGGTLTPVPTEGGVMVEPFSAMVPIKGTSDALITTLDGEVYRFNGQQISRFPLSNEAKRFLKDTPIWAGIQLPNGNIVLSVKRKGLLVLNTSGELIRVLDKSSGLVDLEINEIHLDQQGAMWLATEGGLTRVVYPFPLSSFSEEAGIDGGFTRF